MTVSGSGIDDPDDSFSAFLHSDCRFLYSKGVSAVVAQVRLNPTSYGVNYALKFPLRISGDLPRINRNCGKPGFLDMDCFGIPMEHKLRRCICCVLHRKHIPTNSVRAVEDSRMIFRG